MKTSFALIGLGVATLFVVMGFAGPARAVEIVYTFEGDSTSASDKLSADGQQNGTFHYNANVDSNPANAAFGDSSAYFSNTVESPEPDVVFWNTLELDDTSNLGSQFTLAAMVRLNSSKITRLFSSYGKRPTDGKLTGLILDFYPPGTNTYIKGIRGLYATDSGLTQFTCAGNTPFTYNEYHHLGMTYDDGATILYLDGEQVATGSLGSGPVSTYFNLHVGEDPWTWKANEQLWGNVDDVVVLDWAAPAGVMKSLSLYGAEATLPEPSSLTLLAIGILGLTIRVRRRRR